MSVHPAGARAPARPRGATKAGWASYLAVALLAFFAGVLATTSIGGEPAQGGDASVRVEDGKAPVALPQDGASFEKEGIE